MLLVDVGARPPRGRAGASVAVAPNTVHSYGLETPWGAGVGPTRGSNLREP